MARRKIYTKVEDLRQGIVLLLKESRKELRTCKSNDFFADALSAEARIEVLEDILDLIDAPSYSTSSYSTSSYREDSSPWEQ